MFIYNILAGTLNITMPPPGRVVRHRDKDEAQQKRRRRYSSGDRETWTRKIEYFFACLGYAVGLGNIWRFPYLCYRNGGGAFLIPYLLALALGGIPILFMEMAFGQFASLGPITIWRISPLFKGIGFAIIAVLTLVNTYYNVLIAYSLFYLFASITSVLPWSTCDNKWNTPHCVIQRSNLNASLLLGNLNMSSNGTMTTTVLPLTSITPTVAKLLKTPTEEFFENHLLKKSQGIEELGTVQWPLIVCLAVSWIVCFLCLFKGIKSMGKAVIFTTIFSYVILTVLLIRGATLPGALDGVIYYLRPDFAKLKKLEVWGEACSQAFASLAIGTGGWITLSSYSKFNNKCNRDAVIIGIGNCLTSIYSGFVIFCVLGFMAHRKGVDIDVVTDVGPGLAFVAYPEGLAMIPGAPFWSICFFFMMFTVGLDSLFGQVETIAAGIVDEFPDYLRPRRKLFTLLLCVFMFLCGIPLVTQGGVYIVTLMDWYTLLFSLSIISLCEIIVLMLIYGYKRFCEDIAHMIGSKPSMYYTVCWLGLTPILLLCVIIFLSLNYVPARYGNYRFHPSHEQTGWVIAFVPVALIPLVMIIQFFRTVGSFSRFVTFFRNPTVRSEVMTALIHPVAEWGPALPEMKWKYDSERRRNTLDGAADVFEGAELVNFNKTDNDSNEENVAKKEVTIDPEVQEIPHIAQSNEAPPAYNGNSTENLPLRGEAAKNV